MNGVYYSLTITMNSTVKLCFNEFQIDCKLDRKLCIYLTFINYVSCKYPKPPKLFEIPKDIAALYTFEERVPLNSRYIDSSQWIRNPQNPNWNIPGIDYMMEEIRKKRLKGTYGKKVSNEMLKLLQKYMIENVST